MQSTQRAELHESRPRIDRTDRAADRSRGSALIASLMMVMVVAGLGVCLIRMHSASTRRQVHMIDRKRAFYVAEAGLSEAFLAISQGKSGNVGTQNVPASFGDGVYWVTAVATEEGNIELTSTGLCGVGRFSLSVVLRPQVDPLAARGVFSGADLVVQTGVVVDGYQSSNGTYEEQVAADGNEDHTDGGAVLTSNHDIHLEGPLDGEGGQPTTAIYGEVHPGPTGALIIEPGVTVSGSTTPMNHMAIMPEIEVPVVPAVGSLIVPGGQTVTITSREVYLDSLTVSSNGRLVLAGPLTLVVRDFQVFDRSLVTFDGSGGRVRVVVTERLDFRPGSRIGNTDHDPRQVSLVVAASEWRDMDGDGQLDAPLRFEATGLFHGFLYVPNLALSMPGGLRFFGALAAQSLTLRTGFRMTIDRSLVDNRGEEGGLPRFLSWRIVSLPDTPLVNLRLDPRGLLSLQSITPVPSDQAHKETTVNIDYFDGSGNLQSYFGTAAALDWSQVNTVVSIDWN